MISSPKTWEKDLLIFIKLQHEPQWSGSIAMVMPIQFSLYPNLFIRSRFSFIMFFGTRSMLRPYEVKKSKSISNMNFLSGSANSSILLIVKKWSFPLTSSHFPEVVFPQL